MTVRVKSTSPKRRRASGSSEERFQFWVTLGFIALIVIVVVFLVADVGIAYYNDHFKPIATVGGTAITRDQWANEIKLETFRINHQESQVYAAIAANQISADAGKSTITALENSKSTISTDAAKHLVDAVYTSQLASGENVSASDADIQAAMQQDASTPERRHVQAIFVAPEGAATGTSTPDQNQKAFQDATAAEAALAAGTPFDQVAKQYSTDASKDKGGDYGFITATNTTDPAWVSALFKLPVNGTTPLLKGSDGTYRIGRVSEITPGTVDAAYQSDVVGTVGDAYYREDMTRQALADKLKAKVIADATSGDVDQARLAEIVVNAPSGASATDQGQIHASHILYSPGGDPAAVASLAPDDPGWAAAKQKAQATVDQLKAITDVTQREQKFAELAKTDSNDTASGVNGGDLGFFGQGQMVTEFDSALFDNPNLKPGDIVGPIQTQFGYHVILFQERVPAAADRLKAVTDALAKPGADFAAIAKENSDGDQASAGGELGWRTKDQLDASAATAIFGLQPGQTTTPIQLSDGYHIYKVEEKAKRPLDPQQVSLVSASAYDTWYNQKLSTATSNGDITKDASVFASTNSTSGQ